MNIYKNYFFCRNKRKYKIKMLSREIIEKLDNINIFLSNSRELLENTIDLISYFDTELVKLRTQIINLDNRDSNEILLNILSNWEMKSQELQDGCATLAQNYLNNEIAFDYNIFRENYEDEFGANIDEGNEGNEEHYDIDEGNENEVENNDDENNENEVENDEREIEEIDEDNKENNIIENENIEEKKEVKVEVENINIQHPINNEEQKLENPENSEENLLHILEKDDYNKNTLNINDE